MIRVNAIAPGFIAKTGMTGWIPEKTQKEHAEKNVPSRRIGTPKMLPPRCSISQMPNTRTGKYSQ
jgi:NAD(P)-dependent dehydrogenase (short-subunit alcohol dehydrogenase family)